MRGAAWPPDTIGEFLVIVASYAAGYYLLRHLVHPLLAWVLVEVAILAGAYFLLSSTLFWVLLVVFAFTWVVMTIGAIYDNRSNRALDRLGTDKKDESKVGRRQGP